MSRRSIILWAAALALVGGPLTADDKADAAKDLKAIAGTWTIESREVAGKKWTAEQTKDTILTFDGDKVTLKNGDTVLMTGTQKLDPTKTPKTIDTTVTSEGPLKGKTMLGIYKLDGDTLTVCFDEEGKERPTDFKTKEGTKTFMNVQKRVKK